MLMLYIDETFQRTNFYNISINELFCRIENNPISYKRVVGPRGTGLIQESTAIVKCVPNELMKKNPFDKKIRIKSGTK